MARPKVEIDWDSFDKLCGLQCTVREIASYFECSEDTIKRAVKRAKRMTFEQYVESKRARGNVGLRRKQYELAMAGNVTMLIWCGKQYLGQKDKQERTGHEDIIPKRFTLAIGELPAGSIEAATDTDSAPLTPDE